MDSVVFPGEPSYVYRATVVNVVDGDTIDVDLDVGCHVKLRKRLRFLQVDTWEMRGEERDKGKLAKQYVEQQIQQANNQVFVQTVMDSEGKYGRLLAWVWIKQKDDSIINLNEQLVIEGHGVQY